MTKHVKLGNYAISRRSFVVGAGAAGIVVTLGSRMDPALAKGQPFEANAWVTIGDNDLVTLVCPAPEMGQGVMTSLPALIAEDLDADWSKVKVVQSSPDPKTYGNKSAFGLVIAVSSTSVSNFYQQLRLVGAQTRKVLLANAAKAWKVPVAELSTIPGAVVHKKSGRKMSYGDIAKTAMVPNPLPQATAADLKPLSECRYIGTNIDRVEVPMKVNGMAKYGIDTELREMVYATVLHPPVQGEKAEKINDAAAKAVKGIIQIAPILMGVAVIGETVQATHRAKAALKVTWSHSAPARRYSNDKIGQEYMALAGNRKEKAVEMLKTGDANAAIDDAARVISADYLAEHVAHTCMEPMNATALVKDGHVEIWASHQIPTVVMLVGAKVAGTTPDKVKVNTTLLGGGFGRRLELDFIVEAVILAKMMAGRPVKLIWSREDDFRVDQYRPLAAQRIDVGLDAKGRIVGWRHRVVAASVFARQQPDDFKKLKGKDVVSAGGGVHAPFGEFAYTSDIPAHLFEYLRADRGVDVGAWRGIAAGYTKFAIESMIDEIAAYNKTDPVAFRLGMLKKSPRATKAIQTAADMAGWTRKRPDRALGIAYSDAVSSHTATVAEVSLEQKTGLIRVHKVWVAVDAGVAVQPRHLAAQIESATIFGLGAAISEQIHIKNGEVAESNFDSYHVLRMSEVPQVDVKVISTNNPPSGVGEAGVPPIGPAVANAVAQLSGKRLRHLPMTPARVKAALGA